MNKRKELGEQGEDLAHTYLANKGYVLLEKNYRRKQSEIDLIMQVQTTIVFVEVKYRKSNTFGYPEEFVSANQRRSIIEAADYYLTLNNWGGNIRFDIIAINARFEIEHFEDAFY
ncbi:MAG: YraN family protein [Reichenbachiella sp.]|uniref:YraN family protein n=1 Tax=Reichenbachiella sp. TaxID=2184521 RepID=UPI00326503F9